MGSFPPGFVPGSKFLCQPGTFSVFFVPKWCLVGTFLPGFVPGKRLFVPAGHIFGLFCAQVVSGGHVSARFCSWGVHFFRVGHIPVRICFPGRQEPAEVDAEADAEADRSNRSQSAPARANRCKYMSGRRWVWF